MEKIPINNQRFIDFIFSIATRSIKEPENVMYASEFKILEEDADLCNHETQRSALGTYLSVTISVI